jgi:acyl carrier protein
MHGNLAHPDAAAAPRRQSDAVQGQPRALASGATQAVDCADARLMLANATGISPECIFARTRLEDLIGDSLVLEVVVCELEEFLWIEADRERLWRLETVEDLARHMLEMKALTKI